jgi:hypothetical protein
MTENISIQKVKLIKGGEKLELDIKESGLVKSTDSKTCENPVHPDLSNAVQSLAVHLAILCDFIEPKQSKDTDELEKFTVTGYSIGGKEGEEGVTITGMRKTKTGQKFSINSPFTRFEASEEARYLLMNDLQSKIDTIEGEVKKYLFDGKQLQQSIEFPDKPDDGRVSHLQFAEPLSDEEKGLAKLDMSRDDGDGSGIHVSGKANPEAMERVRNMDNEDAGGSG